MEDSQILEAREIFDSKDYYQVLGLAYDCSLDDIIISFRKLVKKFHPDMTGIQEYSAFDLIMEAYRTLSSENERQSYDTKIGLKKHELTKRDQFPTILLDKLRVQFAFQMNELVRTGLLRKRLKKGALHIKTQRLYDFSITITAQEQSCRIILPIDLPVKKRCPQCMGDSVMASICSVCNGTGQVTEMRSTHIMIPPFIPSGSILKVDLRKASPGGLAYFRSKTLKVKVIVAH